MKQVVYGIVTGLMAVLTLGCVMAIVGKMTRQSDLDNGFATTVEHAVETTMNEKTYTICDREEFIADVTQGLLSQLSNDSSVEIQVAKVNREKGIMAIRVVEHFTHPNGEKGKNECQTTVVFEHVPTETAFVTISYVLDDGKAYKTYELRKGDAVIVPKKPELKDKSFLGWATEGTKELVTDFGAADTDRTYVAVFR